MKITPLTIDFDVTNAQEVEFVNDLMNRLFGSAPLKAMAAPTESPVNSTSVPTFSEPTQTAAPVQEFKKEANPEATAVAIAEETIADAIAEVKKEMKKPEKVAKPKTVKEAPQPTIDLEPVQAPIEEEKATEKASNEPAKADTETKDEAPTLKEMQHLVISSVKTGHVTRDEMASILLEFGGTSLSKVNPSKFALLKQRIENYPLTR